MHFPTVEENQQLLDMPLIEIRISGPDALSILGALQLVLRHPKFQNTAPAAIARLLAEELEKRIGEKAPAFQELCAAGWLRRHDR